MTKMWLNIEDINYVMCEKLVVWHYILYNKDWIY